MTERNEGVHYKDTAANSSRSHSHSTERLCGFLACHRRRFATGQFTAAIVPPYSTGPVGSRSAIRRAAPNSPATGCPAPVSQRAAAPTPAIRPGSEAASRPPPGPSSRSRIARDRNRAAWLSHQHAAGLLGRQQHWRSAGDRRQHRNARRRHRTQHDERGERCRDRQRCRGA